MREATELAPGEAQAYYEDFSLRVGQRDWLSANPRHERLKLLIRDLLRGRRDLRIADIGCGGGVLTDHLPRYGSVVGADFSTAAVALARQLVPDAMFVEGGVEALPAGEYDLITLFDVLEHIPAAERAQFFHDLRSKLADTGFIFCSTPHPTATKQRVESGDPTLQIIDEQVELPMIVAEAAAAGLQLISYLAFDVFRGSPEYQAMVLTPTRSFGGPVNLNYVAVRHGRDVAVLRRLQRAARAALRGDFRSARWFLFGRAPHIQT